MIKNPVKWFFARCLRCLFPNYIRECSEMCEKLFDKVFCKSVSYKVITPDTADHSESQYSKFVTKKKKKKSAIIFKLFKE